MSPIEPQPIAPHRLPGHILKWIIVMVGGGLGGVGIVCGLFFWRCYDHVEYGFCKPIMANPPWVLLSGLAAAPCILLMWHWRTVHREQEIAKGEADVVTARITIKQRDEEVEATLALTKQQADGTRAAQTLDALTRATSMLDSQHLAEKILAVGLLVQAARDSDNKTRATIKSLFAALIRQNYPTHFIELATRKEVSADHQEMVNSLGADFWKDVPVDLSNTDLRDFIFSAGLSFRGATFIGANLYRVFIQEVDFSHSLMMNANLVEATLSKCVLDGASFVGAKMRHMFFIETPVANDVTFSQCDFRGASFINVDLSALSVQDCLYDSGTTFPDGFKPLEHGFRYLEDPNAVVGEPTDAP